MEHWDTLCPHGLKIAYDEHCFPPGTDSFLLSSLPTLKAGLKVCDLGCSTGLLGILLLQRERNIHVTGLELDPAAAALGQRCSAENGLGDTLRILQGDLREVKTLFPTGSFDLCICNPPYYGQASGKVSAALGSARSEVTCTLEDVCAAAKYLLRWGGSFCIVHKPERLTDLLCALRAHAMEPKKLRFVQKNAASAPSLVLCEGRRGGKSGLTVLPPLLLETENGHPTPELNTIYFRKEDSPT